MTTENIKKYAISIGLTFASSFLTIVATSLVTLDSSNITSAAIAGLLLAAVRGSVKIILDKYIPIRLGGRKA